MGIPQQSGRTVNPESLLTQALRGFEERLRAAQVPIAQYVLPPATEADIQRLEAETGYTVVGEPLQWWQWHNGASDPTPDGRLTKQYEPAILLGASAFRPLTLVEGLSRWTKRVRMAAEEELEIDPADRRDFGTPWHSNSWFPIAKSPHGSELLVDLQIGEGESSPIRVWEWGSAEDRARVRARSMYDMVQLWNLAIDRGLWVYNASSGWSNHFQEQTMAERATGFL